MKKVSILFMTMDRYELTRQVLETNLSNHGFDGEIELLWCDNGSQDERIIKLAQIYKPVYFRGNKKNEGCAKGFNQLMLRATGDYFVLMGNDILMPNNWLDEMIKYANHVPSPGLIGIKSAAPIPELQFKFECYAHFTTLKIDRVFGVTLFTKHLYESLGGFNDAFGPYGMEDSELNIRVRLAGFHSLYVPERDFVSKHIGDDVGHNTEYRKMKWDSIAANDVIFNQVLPGYLDGTRPLRCDPPPMREPLV